uniref:30S ribosomal protein S4 n=1 Tax=Compsopogon caeruleus TaxID=31354 RepID=A0A7S1XDQ9_9RHOD|mmetsp:Transcript_18206/g.37964  ORF Transcript_18206/g.37964 Transcript_18206/m.37964 type:complete len:224 (+) Transcript_18206:1682-2353(+)
MRAVRDKRIHALFNRASSLDFFQKPGVPPRPTAGKVASGVYYAKALLEKQKMRIYYGNMKDRVFKRYVEEAKRSRGNPVDYLLSRLESRVDTTLYRSGFVTTMQQGQQWISHGHVLVNGRTMDRKNGAMRPGNMIQIDPSFLAQAAMQAKMAAQIRAKAGGSAAWGVGQDAMLPHLEVNRRTMCIAVIRDPTFEELMALTRAPMFPLVKDANLNPQWALRYYR